MEKVNLQEKFGLLQGFWSPRVVGEVDGLQVKVVKLLGDFPWHSHEEEDELFLVVKGRLRLEFRDGEAVLEEGELLVVPRGTEHRPVAEAEVHVLLVESPSTINTGNVRESRTVENPDWL
jgi:mannose-6-phosphate isomerase-like protein (cupin superfamily)